MASDAGAGRPFPGSPGGRARWQRLLALLALALLYLAAGRAPLPSGLAFQAYLFWPAAALTHTALFVLGAEAAVGILLGSLLLNLGGWLPWPQALAMTFLQTLEPLAAWATLQALGTPHPDLRRPRDLFRWLGAASLASLIFSAALGSLVVGSALTPPGFRHLPSTLLSWFLGDVTAILCLGPFLLLHVRPWWRAEASETPPTRLRHPWVEGGALALLALLFLLTGRLQSDLSPDFRLALQVALLLPALWMALRFGPRTAAAGTALLALGFLGALWVQGRALPEEAFRFSQLFLLVLALSTLATAAAAEEARTARQALELRDLQAQRMEAVGTLAGGLMHEFNNQLTVLMGNLDRLREQAASPEAQGLLVRLDEAAQGLEGTVRQLRALSHQAPLRAQALPLEEALLPFLVTTRSLPLGVAFEADLPPGLRVGLDPELLRQALQVLLTNSLEALQGRGRLRLEAREQGGFVHLALVDDGPGMAPEVLRRAFDPFYSTKPLGRGLGLSIAFSLARQMGGDLLLDSRPGQGTRAELRLPAGPASAPPVPPPTRTPRGHRVLLAEDEPAIRDLTREVLEGEGYEVVEAADGQAAVEIFEADPEAFDLAVLDLVMPRLHGSEVLARLERLRPDLPVLLVSGYSAEARPGLLDAPHRRFLAKPFRIRELAETLADLRPGPAPEATPDADGKC